MMLVSMVGHAIFQTAGTNGPSMIDRSYRPPPGVRGGAGSGNGVVRVVPGSGAVTSVKGGAGPALTSVFDKNSKPTDLIKFAHAAKLVVHPYTHRKDALPKHVKSSEELFQKLFVEAKADGIFSDFCDMVVHWLAKTR